MFVNYYYFSFFYYSSRGVHSHLQIFGSFDIMMYVDAIRIAESFSYFLSSLFVWARATPLVYERQCNISDGDDATRKRRQKMRQYKLTQTRMIPRTTMKETERRIARKLIIFSLINLQPSVVGKVIT